MLWVYDLLWDGPSVPKKPRLRMVCQSSLVSAVSVRGTCFLPWHPVAFHLYRPHPVHRWEPERVNRVAAKGAGICWKNVHWAPGAEYITSWDLWSNCALGVFCISHVQLAASCTRLALIFTSALSVGCIFYFLMPSHWGNPKGDIVQICWGEHCVFPTQS